MNRSSLLKGALAGLAAIAASPARILADPQPKDQPLLHPPFYADFTHARVGSVQIIFWTRKSPYPLMIREARITAVHPEYTQQLDHAGACTAVRPTGRNYLLMDGFKREPGADWYELWQHGRLLKREVLN